MASTKNTSSKKKAARKKAARKTYPKKKGGGEMQLEALILGWLTIPEVGKLLSKGKAAQALALLNIDNPQLAELLNQVDKELISKIVKVTKPPGKITIMG